jgi:hypothetical protein
MLRAERAQLTIRPTGADMPHTMARDLLIAMAPPPRTHVYDLTGWPQWLAPTFRSGGHRNAAHLRGSEK